MRYACLFLFLAVCVAAFILGRALAHGEADWIMRDPATRSCCGPSDCGWIDASDVTLAGGHYVIARGAAIRDLGQTLASPGYRIPAREARPSRDHHYWLCSGANRAPRCFFAPAVGF